MSETGMKNKVASGLFWKLLENGGAQGIQFVIAILLARLLTPAEYGVVGIIMIFITIANVFVQSGFSTALVQKKQADEVDFSSVCYFELAASVVFYVLLYLAAPAIAEFYAIPVLKPIVRVLGIVLFPGAVISVQTAYVSRSMEFRGLFFSTLAASAISGVTAKVIGVSIFAFHQLLLSVGQGVPGSLGSSTLLVGAVVALLDIDGIDQVCHVLCGSLVGVLAGCFAAGSGRRTCCAGSGAGCGAAAAAEHTGAQSQGSQGGSSLADVAFSHDEFLSFLFV